MRLQICEHVQQTKQQNAAMSNVSVILQSWKGRILWKDLVTLDVSHPANQFPTTASVAAQSHRSCLRQECESQCYFVCFRAQLVQCILCPVSLKLGCKGLCDCSLFRFELGLRNLQLIWCNCLLVIFICFGEAGQAGSSQTWHQTMMNWRLLIQAKTSRSYCRDQAVPYPSIP